MENSKFVIVGEPCCGEQLYFNEPKKLWVEFEDATLFTKEILASTPPVGASGIMEINDKGSPLGFYEIQTEESI
jgi:hypothetical protein